MDLSLVPIEDMIKEIQNRSDAYILATLRTEEANDPIVKTYWEENKFIDCLGICSVLEEDIKKYYMRGKEDE